MKNLKNIVLTLVALVIAATAINANPLKLVNSFKGEDPLTVKFMGDDGTYLLFQVTVNADNAKTSSFAISDKSEGEIYAAYIKPNNNVQTVKIEKRDNQQLDFKLVIGKEVYLKSFAVLSPVIMKAK